jgi:hypothetical protein
VLITLTLTKLYNLAVASLLTCALFAACFAAQSHTGTDVLVKQGQNAATRATTTGQQLDQGTQEVGRQLLTEGATVQGIGKGIQEDVARGRAATPPDGVAPLKDIWDSIAARANGVLNVAAAINGLADKVGELNGQVHTLNADVGTLVETNKGLAEKTKDAETKAASAEKAAQKASSQTAHLTALLVVLAIAAAGAGVFFGFMLKDVKVGIAGIAGAVTIMILASLFGKIDAAMGTLVHVAAIVAGVGAGLFLLEVLWRKLGPEKRAWTDALATAFKTNPFQDVQDIIADLQGKPAA